MSKVRTSVEVGNIISGAPFVNGRHLRTNRRGSAVLVGYPEPYESTGEDDPYIDVSDPSRAQAFYLVTSVTPDGVEAIRLDQNMDYPGYGAETISFTFDPTVAPNRAITSVELLAIARNAATIQVGDVIKSGRFGEEKILNFPGKTAPTADDRFVVTGLSMEGGGADGHNTKSVPFPNGRYVKAVRLDESARYSPDSARVEFYMSGCFIREVMLQSVVVIGQSVATLVEVKLFDLQNDDLTSTIAELSQHYPNLNFVLPDFMTSGQQGWLQTRYRDHFQRVVGTLTLMREYGENQPQDGSLQAAWSVIQHFCQHGVLNDDQIETLNTYARQVCGANAEQE